MNFLREPLVHFLLAGAAIYLLYAVFAKPVPEAGHKTIVVTAGEIEWMQTSWQQRWNRPPTAEEFDGLLEQYIRETVLYREALAMGLNKHDQVIRRRLAQKLEFLAKDLVTLAPPTDDDLRAYFDENQARYQEPTRFTFTQVFFDPDKRGDATLDDAEAVKATLMLQGARAVENAGALGDVSLLQHYYPEKDPLEIRKQFGSGFATSLLELTPGQWHGPVLSGYGVHLVYVNRISEPAPPRFAEVRERVMQDWKTDKSEDVNEQFYASLREQYTIVIEEQSENEDVTVLLEPTP